MLPEVTSPEMTCHVTGNDVSHVTVSDVSHMTGSDVITGSDVFSPALFSYYSSSITSTVPIYYSRAVINSGVLIYTTRRYTRILRGI